MRRALLLAAVLALFAGAAAAQDDSEVINDYASDITVAKDGTLSVAERIDITAAGIQIHHGIYRDFPTTYTDRYGRKVRVRFAVSGVTRDGVDEPYSTESLSNGVRVKIGSADTEIAPGRHLYAIRYTADRQIGFFRTFDELYWNVTGTGWIFPIEHAEATVHLPAPARIVQSAFYTGAQGTRGTDATAEATGERDIRFATTAPLDSHEGLTIAVGFTKGAVAPPTGSQEARSFFADNAPILIALAGLLVLCIYYGVAWLFFGRDPSLGTVIPLFAPPKGFSAAAVRYVHRMAYDRKAFAAALIAMAVKGFMKISEDDREYTLTRTGKSVGEAGLSNGENAIANALFDGSTNSIVLEQSNHSDIARAIAGVKKALVNEYERRYFVTNIGWFFGGLAILALTGIGAALVSDDAAAAAFMLTWLSGWSIGTSLLVHRAANAWGDVLHGPGSRILNFFSAVFASVFALPFLGGLIFVLVAFAGAISLPAMLALALGGVLAYIFYHLLKVPTLAGAKIMGEIEGFRIFLDTAEKDRLEKLHPPQVTPEVFERFLPYAIALDCENRWSKRFEAEAAAAAADPGRAGTYAYQPLWYSGSSFSRLGTAGFVSAIGASVAGAAAAASAAPGSSSGSSGGGFSGGGGGGGGGGGW
ncbi:MAG: DUF2207 domain-containing protein [Pseudomonadota bacterium]|nr:DUF2207 domain-containing protein [Pseudomonadota bacterium]